MRKSWSSHTSACKNFLSFRAITVRDLFPFGRDNGDDSLYAGTDADNGAEDISSAEIALATNVRFFGRDYGAIYVSWNSFTICKICMRMKQNDN